MDESIVSRLKENTERINSRIGAFLQKSKDADTAYKACDYVFDEELTCLSRQGVGASFHAEQFNGIPHRHGFFEILLVLRGSVVEDVGGKRIHLGVGDAVMHNPAAVHTVVKYDSQRDLALNLLVSREVFSQSFYSIVIRDARLNAFFNRTLADTENFMEFHDTQAGVLRVLEHLLSELFRPSPSDAVLGSSLLLFFAELLRSYKTEESASSGELTRYLAENLATVTLESCAEHFGYHPKYLSTLIKRREGVSFTQLLRTLRLRAAESYLRFSDDSIETVAERVGYHDPCSLYELFRREHGVSPAVWRKKRSGSDL